MDGNKRNCFKKLSNTQFKRSGNKKGKWNNSNREYSSGSSQSNDTVYRILCPSRKIGGVIGRGGGIVKALREETQAKIKVADPVPGSEERVIIIYSSPTRVSRKQNNGGDSDKEHKEEGMQLNCAAQDALLKVHDKIVEEELFGGLTSGDDNDNTVVTARLLVPKNLVGCLLGKRGDVIQRLRSDTGASIRVLNAEHLPSCAMDTDELVQVSGKLDVAKKALYAVSTLLHQNPRKDKPSISPMPFGSQGFHPPRTHIDNILPLGNPMRSHPNHPSPGMPSMPWEGVGNQPSGFASSGINGVPPGRSGEAQAEFSMKILCSAERIGGVIGKGGFKVKMLQQETGATIHVQDASAETVDRVIRVSAFEALWNSRSETIEAILQLQNITGEISDKCIITTRLLVPLSKVGCILGQGGHVINELRRRTQADIRIFSKDDKPKCAAEDEGLVQISGNFGVAKDALAEIASRLRVRTLRDANAGEEHTPVGSVQGFGHARHLPGGPPLPSSVGAGSYTGYDHVKIGHEYKAQSYPVTQAAPRYTNFNTMFEGRLPYDAARSVTGGGTNFSNSSEIFGARVKLHDSQVGGSDRVEILNSSEHLNTAHSILRSFKATTGQRTHSQHGFYENVNTLQGSYNSVVNAPRSPYQMNAQQGSYNSVSAPRSPYRMNAQQGSYNSVSAPRSPYRMNAQQGSYNSVSASLSPYQTNAQQSPYQLSAQQRVYPYINAPQIAYQISAQQGSYRY